MLLQGCMGRIPPVPTQLLGGIQIEIFVCYLSIDSCISKYFPLSIETHLRLQK